MKVFNGKYLLFLVLFITSQFSLAAQQEPEKVSFKAKDGLLITADFYPSGERNAPTIILFHQSVSSRGEYITIAPRLQKAGYNALAVDLRWGRRDFWNNIVNETAARYGIESILKAIDEEDKKELIWPTIFDAYQDMEAALEWTKENISESPIWIWGSSFSAMLQFKLASERADDIAGLISFSPGEYYPEDTLLLNRWARQVDVPVFISCGKGPDELKSGQLLLEALPAPKKTLFHSKQGRHGSSMLFTDEDNWSALLSFLWSFIPKEKYLQDALKVGNWLEEHEKKEGDYVFWPDELGSDKVSPSLSVGMTGKVLFFLELWQASKEKHWLEKARQAGDFLLSRLPIQTDSGLEKGGAFSLYGNVCGTGTALAALYQQTGNAAYREGLENITELIKTKAQYSEKGAYWDSQNDVLTGLAGTALFLLQASDVLGDSSALFLAEKAGMELLHRALEEDNGLNWYWAQDRKFVLPNFSHGTAGIGYLMACLYEHSGKKVFLEAAHKANDFLLSHAYTEGGRLLLPYGIPNDGWDRSYDLGWAHGVAGSGRLFYKLYEVSGEKKYLDYMKASAEGVLSSGVFGQMDTIFGKDAFPVDVRFGMAGMAEFLIHCTEQTDDPVYAQFARQLVDEIVSKGNHDSRNLYWSIPAYGFMGNEGAPKTFTGYFYGAAGNGLLLLQMDAFLKGRQKRFFLPDNPFKE